MSHTTKLEGDGCVTVNVIHNSDWSGGVEVQWRRGEERGQFRIPGDVARVLLHGYNYDKYGLLLIRLRELLEAEGA